MNEDKTDICLFYKRDHPTVAITINHKVIISKTQINVLGVIFDSKLQWSNQVSQAVSKSKRALHGIRLIKKYLTKDETRMLLTANFYSVLFYNCEIWMSEGLHARQKQLLLSASANALKLLGNVQDIRISFAQRHIYQKRAMPMDFSKYKLSIQLYKIYNGNDMDNEWLDMNTQQNFNSRLKLFQINDFSKTRVGRNIIANRMTVLNNQINLDWLNLSLISFKLKVKNLFLMN